MQLGMIGLGRMGRNMGARLVDSGHSVVGYDQDPAISQVVDLPGLMAAIAAPLHRGRGRLTRHRTTPLGPRAEPSVSMRR